MKTNGNSLLSQAITTKDTSSDSIKTLRLGVGNDSYIQKKVDALKFAYYYAYTGTTSSKRRKRAITSLTCSDLYSLSNTLSIISASKLSTLTSTEFSNCITFYSTYAWSVSQAGALSTLMLNQYSNDVTTIPDSELAYYSTIMIALTPAQLATLKISSLNTLNAFGLVNTWSNDQLASLVTAIKTNGDSLTSSDVLSQMKNLACGVSSSDWSTIPASVISTAQSVLSVIDNADCLVIPSVFASLRPSSFDSASLTDLGVISGGIQPSDLSSAAVTVDLLSFVNLKYVSAATVNSMSTEYLNVLTTSQISELTNSPYYSSFSNTVQMALSTLASGKTATSATTTSSSTVLNTNGLVVIFTSLLVFFVK